ncbi:CCR4-NOT transcription complex subunit 4 [Frankliniella fusca]|uniref:CCR4-NOT transcription complex subunit 4 n=1 Tax=Frankliniella fusca TaxID=407009 RepID=A0AAE1HNV7_9NEOP|nr:CCR4-NOT transcription complex subunit 4 [Frankliniella fusca]
MLIIRFPFQHYFCLVADTKSIMSVLNQSGEEQVECPLCMEPLEVDDLNFFPCTCGYQICRFCWHRIRTDENGLCPACRKAYPENPADFKPLSQEEVSRLKQEKRNKDHQRKQKVTENRKHLANVRVVQKNLVFVVGLPTRLADPEVLKKHEYFGKFGKIHKVVINQSTTYAGSQGPSASAYVTYFKPDDALRAIQAVQNVPVDGRTIKTSLGTTKYCSHFMKNQVCPKPDCMYLHDHGDPEASFTKEEMQQGKHQEFEKRLHDQLLNSYNKDRKPTPSPPSAVGSTGQPSIQPSKEAWPSLQPGTTINSDLQDNVDVDQFEDDLEGRIETIDVTVKSDRVEKTERLSQSQRNDLTESNFGEVENTLYSSSTPVSTSSEESSPAGRSSPAHLSASHRAASLLEPDNNSFFSAGFTKVNQPSNTVPNSDWAPANGVSHMPDVLPSVHSSEDWQAAFGFGSNNMVPENKQTSAAAMLAKYHAWLGLSGQQKLENSGVSVVNSNSVPGVTDQQYAHQTNSFGSVRLPENPSLLMHNAFQHQQQQHHHQQQQQQQSFLLHLQQQQALRLQHGSLASAGPEVGFLASDVSQENRINNGPTERADAFLHFDQRSANSIINNSQEDYFNSDNSERRHTDDDLGFDPFHETQKGLAEMMEKEQLLKQQQQQSHLHLQQQQHQQHLLQQAQLAALNQQHSFQQHNPLYHRLTPQSQVSNCTKLLEGLGIGLNSSMAARSRPPPPGFAPTPNHMNAFGLGIPRTAPTSSNTSSNLGKNHFSGNHHLQPSSDKVLPFMGLGSVGNSANSSSASSSSGSQSSQHMPFMSNGSILNQGMSKTTVDSMFASAKEWPENFRSLLPNLGAQAQTPTHSYTAQKSATTSWNCPDWTALDPAIVSSSRPHWPASSPMNTPTPPPGFGFGQQLPHTINTTNMDNA